MIRAACYVRVSTDNQLENYSIEEQTDRLQAFCKAKDITVVKMYTDGGYSGGNINRPALHQMLSDIETGNIDVVVGSFVSEPKRHADVDRRLFSKK